MQGTLCTALLMVGGAWCSSLADSIQSITAMCPEAACSSFGAPCLHSAAYERRGALDLHTQGTKVHFACLLCSSALLNCGLRDAARMLRAGIVPLRKASLSELFRNGVLL